MWVTHATQKVRPMDAPGSTTSAEVKAARNEFEAFQVLVHGGTSGVTGVRAAAPTLAGPLSASIPSPNVRLYRASTPESPAPGEDATGDTTGSSTGSVAPTIKERVASSCQTVAGGPLSLLGLLGLLAFRRLR